MRFVVRNADPINHELIVGPPEVHARHSQGTEAFHPPVPGEVSIPALEQAVTTYTFDTPGHVRLRVPPSRPPRLRHARRGRGGRGALLTRA